MKLNKQTIEYIGKLVSDKAAPKLVELQAEINVLKAKKDALIARTDAAVDALLKEMGKKVNALFKKSGVTLVYWSDEPNEIELQYKDVRDKRTVFDKDIDAASKKLKELKAAVEDKTTEVVAKLSLGGDADDLARLIAELKF